MSKKSKPSLKKFKASHIGHYARIHYSDVGARDGIIISISDDKTSCQWFSLSERVFPDRVPADMIIGIGARVTAEHSGL